MEETSDPCDNANEGEEGRGFGPQETQELGLFFGRL